MKCAEQMREGTGIQRRFLFFHHSNGVCNDVGNGWVFVSGFTDFDKIIHVIGFLLGKSFNLILLFLKSFLKLLGSCIFFCFLGFSSFDCISNYGVFQVCKSRLFLGFFFFFLNFFKSFVFSLGFFSFLLNFCCS